MNKVISGFMIVLVLLVAGCTTNYVKDTGSNQPSSIQDDCFPFCDDDNPQIDEKTFTIGGVDNYQEISSEQPVKIIVSGVRNEVSVSEGTTVNSIIVSGTDITINLPGGSNPKIIDSGVRTTIKYS